MHHDGSRLPPAWGSWLALLLWLSLFWCLLGAAFPLHGQTPNERLASIERELTYSLATCGKLSNELTAQSARVVSLQADLAALRASLPIYAQKLTDLESELKASKALSESLQSEIARLRDLLLTSQGRLDELSKTFGSYKAAKDHEVKALGTQVTGWRVLTVVLGAAAAGLGVWAAVK